MVIVLMFMLMLTSLAVFSARYGTLGEEMAANHLDQERARQAAEAALRDAERDLLLTAAVRPANARCDRRPDRPVFERTASFDNQCRRGQCEPSPTAATQSNWTTGSDAERWWPDDRGGRWANKAAKPSVAAGSDVNCNFAGGVPIGTFTGAAEVQGVRRQPEYLIEYFQAGSGRSGDYFRITARGFGTNPATEVVMQSYFQPYVIQ
jgi:type IV pilus assembly protein PilX